MGCKNNHTADVQNYETLLDQRLPVRELTPKGTPLAKMTTDDSTVVAALAANTFSDCCPFVQTLAPDSAQDIGALMLHPVRH